MSDISAPVGDNKVNRPHDVALVQLLLRAAKVTGRARHFDAFYDGIYTRRLGEAIAAFQGGGGTVPDGGASDGLGVIEPRSSTWIADDFAVAHIAAVKNLLRAEFQSAADHRKQWKSVKYSDSTRRPVHKK